MANVKLTYADGTVEVVELEGHVRVEVDAASPFSRTFNAAGLVGVELTDDAVTTPESVDAAGAPAVAPVGTVADAEAQAPKPKVRKPRAKRGPGAAKSHTPAKDTPKSDKAKAAGK